MQTRAKRQIENSFERKSADAGKILETNELMKRFDDCTHRTNAPDLVYNCHGLTFASRRTNITAQEALNIILEDDGYRKVGKNDVAPGDIVIYRAPEEDGGEIEHSGVVVGVENDNRLLFGQKIT